ncbi:hypothetical protein [Diaphorina citri associated C virus]|nr:hypothetical protein [Diaphorina citri associated C virus]
MGVRHSYLWRLLVRAHQIFAHKNRHSGSLLGYLLLWTMGTIILISPSEAKARHAHHHITLIDNGSTIIQRQASTQHPTKGDQHHKDSQAIFTSHPELYPIDTWQNDFTKNLSDIIVGPEINFIQCIQVLYTGSFSAVTCNLPVHCGSIVYKKIYSTWYNSETGICYGLGNKPVFTRLNGNTHTPSGWLQLYDVTTTTKHDYSLRLLFDPAQQQYIQISDTALNMRVMINTTSFSYVPPTLQSVQGHYCIPKVIQSNCPLYRVTREWWHDLLWDYQYDSTFPSKHPIMLAYYMCYMGTIPARTEATSQQVTCDALLTTTHYWPGFISNFPNVISTYGIIIIHTLGHYLLLIVEQLLRQLAKLVDIPTFILAFYIMHQIDHNAVHCAIVAIIAGITFTII